MLGQLKISDRGSGKADLGRLYGLPVLRAEADRSGFWGEHRLKRAAKGVRRGGALRVLAPPGFDGWPVLKALGLRPVEPDAFVRAQSVPLALAALEREDWTPDRATVALRGLRADREMVRAAVELCPYVRRLVVDAPNGGEKLAVWLRGEFGIPVLPRREEGQVALCFHPESAPPEQTALKLYGPDPWLAGMSLTAPSLEEEDRDDLSLLAALWAGGKLGREDIEIT